jgi:hypothetical protein
MTYEQALARMEEKLQSRLEDRDSQSLDTYEWGFVAATKLALEDVQILRQIVEEDLLAKQEWNN